MTSVVTSGAPLALTTHARTILGEAARTTDSGERFRLAHLAALRAGAAVCAARAVAAPRRRLVSVWVLLERVAPEHRDWAVYFAAAAKLRAAIEAGAVSAVTERVADDQLRAAGEFLAIVERTLGLLAA